MTAMSHGQGTVKAQTGQNRERNNLNPGNKQKVKKQKVITVVRVGSHRRKGTDTIASQSESLSVCVYMNSLWHGV